MDSAQFDGLVRRFGQSRSRRQTLRGLAGIAASGALALSGRAVSAQECKRDGKACKKNSQCCSGTCGVGTGQGSLPGACAPGCLPEGGTPSCGPDCCDSTLCCSGLALAGPGVCICCGPQGQGCF